MWKEESGGELASALRVFSGAALIGACLAGFLAAVNALLGLGPLGGFVATTPPIGLVGVATTVGVLVHADRLGQIALAVK